MATLSRKTCSTLIELLESRFTRTSIEKILYDAEIPNEFLGGSNKRELLLTVIRRLDDHQYSDKLLNLFKVTLPQLPVDAEKILKTALLSDGYVFDDDKVVPDDNLAEEHKTALAHLVGVHRSKLTAATLTHHLSQAEELYRMDKWDASIGQSRNFVEQLLIDIATYAAGRRGDSPDLSQPSRVRDYLVRVRFFDSNERKKLVDGVYGYFSERGSHPGIEEQSTARICLSILWNFGFYVLEKLENWKPDPD